MAGIAALTLAYVLSQFYRSFLAVLTPALTAEIGATKADLSIASGAWFLAFAAAQFGVGISLDRFGPRRTAALMLAACGGGGSALFALAETPAMVTVAMALIGVGCAPVLMAAVYIFARNFHPARMAVLTSSVVGTGTLGNVFGAAPLAWSVEAFGWRGVLAAMAAVSLLVAAAVFVLVRDPPPDDAQGRTGGLGGYLELLKIGALWWLIPLTALNYAPAVGIRGLWSGPYLTDVYGADALAIGQVTLVMALAMVAGNFLYGPLDAIFGTRKWVAVVGNLLSLCLLGWMAMHVGTGVIHDTILFALIGLFGASYGLLMAHARPLIPAHLTGRGVTLMNFFSIGGVGAMQFATGAVVTQSAVPGAPTEAYSTLFWFYAGSLAVALVIYLFCRDAKPGR